MRWSDQVLLLIDRHRRLLLTALVLAYLLGFSGQWRPEPDSALYIALGRNLAAGKGYTFHDKPHRLAYPGLPFMLAGIDRISGEHAMFMSHVLILAMGLASLAMMYRLMSLHAGRAVAVMMTVGLGISYTFYRYCYELRSDMPFMLGVMMVLAGYEGILIESAGRRKKPLDWILLIVGLGLAIVTRPTMWALLAALLAAVVWGVIRGRFSKKLLLVPAVIALAAVSFIAADPRRGNAEAHRLGDYEDVVLESVSVPKLIANVSELLDPHASEALFGIDFGHAVRLGPISLQMIASVIALAAGLLVFRERSLWGLWFLLTALMMLVTLARDRYFLPVLPMMVYGWWTLIREINFRVPGRWGNLLFGALFLLGIVPNSAKVGWLIFEQRHPNVLTIVRDGRYESMYRVAEMIDAQVPRGSWVIAPKKFGRIFSALTGRNVTEPGDVKGNERSFAEYYLLEPAKFEPDSPLIQPLLYTIGPPLASVKGKYDDKPWTLRFVKAVEGTR